MPIKNILFVIGNEYHLYSALCNYYKYFTTDNYNFKLLITKRPKNHRITNKYELPFEYFVLDDYLNFEDFRSVKIYPDYEKILNGIFDKVDELYTYYDFTLLSSLIINWARRNPYTKTYLMQEGVAGYFKYKMPIKKLFKFYFVFIYVRFIMKIRMIDFVYQWGFYSKIDVLKMAYPNEVKIKTRSEIQKLDIDITPEIHQKIKAIFQFDFTFKKDQRYLLYMPIGLASGSKKAKIKEYDLIYKLIAIAKTNDLEFLIKIKSGVESHSYMERYREKVLIIDNKVPAEIIISEIYNSYVLSAFSSATLHSVNNNKYFWIYPLLNFKTNLKPFTSTIKLIQSYDELEKCIQ
ncbi:MAG: hypothetical protein JXB49_25215 [Bacteroidales bacterium]|nr:hypothetical protein [Bacteroidales bacterium]